MSPTNLLHNSSAFSPFLSCALASAKTSFISLLSFVFCKFPPLYSGRFGEGPPVQRVFHLRQHIRYTALRLRLFPTCRYPKVTPAVAICFEPLSVRCPPLTFLFDAVLLYQILIALPLDDTDLTACMPISLNVNILYHLIASIKILSAKTFFEAICKPVYFYLFYNNFKSFNIIMNPRKYHNLVAASNFDCFQFYTRILYLVQARQLYCTSIINSLNLK